MVKRYNIFSIMFIVMSLFFISQVGVFAGSFDSNSMIKVKLLNQNPDPVNPGDILEVRLGVENLGGEKEEGFIIGVEPSYPFILIDGEKNIQNIGTIDGYSSDESINVVKFKVKVLSDVKAGNYVLKFKTKSFTKNEVVREVIIKVESDSNAEITSINTDSLVPGKKTEIIFGIKNVGKSELKNVEFSWDSQNDIILPVGSSNVKYIDSIEVGKTEFVKFNVVSDLNTNPSLYKLDLKLVYDDVESLQQITQAGQIKTESRKSVISKAGIYVGGGTDLDLAFSEFSDNEATFTISNIGSNTANAVNIEILNDENWNILGTNSQIIGNVKKGGFTSTSFKIKPIKDGDNDLKIKIEYTDTTGTRQVLNKTLNLNADLFNEVVLNINESKSGNSKTWFFVVVIIILIGGFVFYKKRKNKKNE